MVLAPYPEDTLALNGFEATHPEQGHWVSGEAMPHVAHFDKVPRLRSALDSSFFMSAVGNMAGGKGGGMLGAGAGAALGSFGTYMICKKMKGCNNECGKAPPDCPKCLDTCAKLSAAGAAVAGAGGSALGQKMMPGTKGGGAAGMYSIFNEDNTAQGFALLQQMKPPGVDGPVGHSGKHKDRKSRSSNFFPDVREPGHASYVGEDDMMVCFSNVNCSDLGIVSDLSTGYSHGIQTVTAGGLVDRWNQEHSDRPELQFEEGDVIVRVSNQMDNPADFMTISGSAADILAECQSRSLLTKAMEDIKIATFLHRPVGPAKGQSGAYGGRVGQDKGAGRGERRLDESEGRGKGEAHQDASRGKGKGKGEALPDANQGQPAQQVVMGKGKGA